MSRHTKDQWQLHPYNECMGSLISFGDISKGETIAIVCAQKDAEEGKAIARLVAAAPKLLEAAKAALEVFEAMDHKDIVCAIDLRAAIAEAEVQ